MTSSPRRQSNPEPIYPALNIYSSSRVANQRVNNSKIPLLKYRQPVEINNCKKNFDSEIIDPLLLRKLEQKDGLIYSIKKMKDRKSNINGIKILVCVCMYNQSKDAINLTLNGIYNNLTHMKSHGISQGDIAVVLVQDGILKLVNNRKKRDFVKGDKSMVRFYEKMDIFENKPKCELVQRINTILDQTENFQRKGMKNKVINNRDIPPSIEKNIALVYQNMWYPVKTYFQDSGLKEYSEKRERLRTFSCFKHTNGTKLSSHLWFFQGFCRYFKPQFCVLLDVGTTPGRHGLVNLIRGFDTGPNIGGVSGFMTVDTDFKSQQGEHAQKKYDNCLMNNFFSIQRAQEYEYIISHFLDKNQQSALGFLHVLPGAWSAYRYQALIKSQKYQPNLLQRSYFKMVLNPDLEQKDLAQANMYLAEDRILSLGIYCQMQSQYLLRYVPDAKAYTDPMKSHENLMNQRRRWINSSMFAFLYVYKNYYFNVMDSNHNFFRKYITLNLSMFVALLSMFNTYIAPSLYFFILYATIYQLGFRGSEWVAKSACAIYVLVFMVAVGGALTGKVWTKRAHIVSVMLAFFTVLLTFLVIYNVFIIYLRVTHNPMRPLQQGQIPFRFSLTDGNRILTLVLIMLIINAACFIILLLVHFPTHPLFVWKLMVDSLSYLAYTGAYSQTMVVHAFCNVDDVSWGTKGSGGNTQKKYQKDKVFFVGSWLLTNAVLAFIFIYIDIISRENTETDRGDVVLVAIAVYGTFFILLKSSFAVYHQIKWMCCIKCCTKPQIGGSQRMEFIDRYWKKEISHWKKNLQKQSKFAEVSKIHKKGG